MWVLVSVIGLIFLFSYFIFARLSFKLTLDRNETGLAFTMQAFSYLSPDRRYLEYYYENLDVDIIPALDRAAVFSDRLKRRARHDDVKAYLIRLGFHDYRTFVKTFFHYAIVEEMNWESKIGLQDAMYTGIFTGVLWAIKGIFSSMISMNSRVEQFHLKVDPVYSQEIFTTILHCIIKIRIVHIIFIAVYMLFMIVRGYINGYRPGKTESSYRGAYENSYGKY